MLRLHMAWSLAVQSSGGLSRFCFMRMSRLVPLTKWWQIATRLLWHDSLRMTRTSQNLGKISLPFPSHRSFWRWSKLCSFKRRTVYTCFFDVENESILLMELQFSNINIALNSWSDISLYPKDCLFYVHKSQVFVGYWCAKFLNTTIRISCCSNRRRSWRSS